MRISLQCLLVVLMLQTLSGCSLNGLSARLSSYFIDQRMESLNRETDLKKVKTQLLADIKQLEKQIRSNRKAGRNNGRFYHYAARAYYSYAFAFLEDRKPKMAADYYYKAYQYGKQGLASHGLNGRLMQGSAKKLERALKKLPEASVDALYWTAMSWAKVIELKQPNVLLLTQLPKTAQIMEQVKRFDPHYNLGGPDMFFAVYYSVRPVYLGGNEALARQHFERARKVNKSRLLLVDYLQAKYHYKADKEARKRQRQLRKIIRAEDNLYPEQELINTISKRKAAHLLAKDSARIAKDQTFRGVIREQAGIFP